ncbi:MAG TPA: thiol reductant ABC exporter subunit CydC [Streptosporangiaceae bacterium]|nr:thiol reductant ABC exporter subunit CydC [Streptosporangiaceae bacterium]
MPSADLTDNRGSLCGEHPAARSPEASNPQTALGWQTPLRRLMTLALAKPLRGRLVVVALVGVLATGCGVALLAVSGFLLARASQHPDIAALSVAVVAVRALSIGRGGFRYAERLASHDVAFRVLARVRVAIWRRLEAVAPAGLPGFHTGDLLTRLVSDVDSIQDLFIRGLNPLLAAVVVGCGAVLTCLALIGRAGLILAAGLSLGIAVVPLLCVRTSQRAVRRAATARGQLGSAVTDVLSGATELQAFDARDYALARVKKAEKELAACSTRLGTAAGLGTALPTLMAGLTVWAVLLLGVDAVDAGTINRVPLAVATLTAMATFEAVAVLPAAAIALNQTSASARRITEIIDAPAPVSDPSHPRSLPLPVGAVTISFRNAGVRYHPDGPLALDNFSLDLPPGRRIALVGPNGAGKSTVASVLLRFRAVTSGMVTITGTGPQGDFGPEELSAYRADDIRKIIGGCPQDPHLFNTTIAENLKLAHPEATDSDLLQACHQVGLANWIDSLPAGLDTPVGQNGSALSGGQQQRIALARTLLANPQVIILDEPTAHLDAEARHTFLTDLFAATTARSVLLITHDLADLEEADEIVVLDHGTRLT